MSSRLIALLLAASVLLLGGCASSPMQAVKTAFESKSEQTLSAGIAAYQEGKFAEAAKSIQNALDLGLGTADQVRAHKYLAFIHCISGRERQCRAEFRKALDIDPRMDLEPAEAGHPTWGPVFRSVKYGKSELRK
jgi:Tfp pilus assembly protein PilF